MPRGFALDYLVLSSLDLGARPRPWLIDEHTPLRPRCRLVHLGAAV